MSDKIFIKDMNVEASKALRLLKNVCETFNGCCRQCPIGEYVKGQYGFDYKCALKEHEPRFFKINPVKPFRLIQGDYKEVEVK